GLIRGISDGPDEDIVLLDGVPVHVAEDSGIAAVSAQRIRPVVQKPFDSETGSGGDGLGRPSEGFASQFSGADDDQVLRDGRDGRGSLGSRDSLDGRGSLGSGPLMVAARVRFGAT